MQGAAGFVKFQNGIKTPMCVPSGSSTYCTLCTFNSPFLSWSRRSLFCQRHFESSCEKVASVPYHGQQSGAPMHAVLLWCTVLVVARERGALRRGGVSAGEVVSRGSDLTLQRALPRKTCLRLPVESYQEVWRICTLALRDCAVCVSVCVVCL